MQYILIDEQRRQNAIKEIQGLDISKPIEVIIQPYKKSRSKAQNAYWFVGLDKYAKPVFNEHGDNWDAWRIHEYVMEQCGYKEVLIDPRGEPYESRMHSRLMKTKAFNEMIEKCHAYLLMEHNINIPLPR